MSQLVGEIQFSPLSFAAAPHTAHHLLAPKSKVISGNQATFPLVDWISAGVRDATFLGGSKVCPDSAIPSLGGNSDANHETSNFLIAKYCFPGTKAFQSEHVLKTIKQAVHVQINFH